MTTDELKQKHFDLGTPFNRVCEYCARPIIYMKIKHSTEVLAGPSGNLVKDMWGDFETDEKTPHVWACTRGK